MRRRLSRAERIEASGNSADAISSASVAALFSKSHNRAAAMSQTAHAILRLGISYPMGVRHLNGAQKLTQNILRGYSA